MTTVTIDALSVTLNDQPILEDVTTRVDPGTFVGLVGPNGAGKTTLLRTINGRLTPTTGRVSINGDSVHALSARETAKHVATVPQHPVLRFDFTVRDIVAMGRHPHRPRFGIHDPGRDRIEWALDRTATTPLADRFITAVSGGERQRVLLARALAQDTPVLLLDEPTSSLDINHQVRTLGLLRSLVDHDDKTIIAAIHDLDLAARFCDDIVLLNDGRIRASGTPTTVLTAEHLEPAFDTPVAVGTDTLTGTPTVTALPEPPRSRDARVHVVCSGDTGTPLLYSLVAAGFEVTVGPVPRHAVDHATARLLDLETVTTPPHAPLTRANTEPAVQHARTADATVLAASDITPASLRLLDVADAATRLVLVTEPNPTTPAWPADAGARYRRLRDRAVTTTPTDAPGVLARLLDPQESPDPLTASESS